MKEICTCGQREATGYSDALHGECPVHYKKRTRRGDATPICECECHDKWNRAEYERDCTRCHCY